MREYSQDTSYISKAGATRNLVFKHTHLVMNQNKIIRHSNKTNRGCSLTVKYVVRWWHSFVVLPKGNSACYGGLSRLWDAGSNPAGSSFFLFLLHFSPRYLLGSHWTRDFYTFFLSIYDRVYQAYLQTQKQERAGKSKPFCSHRPSPHRKAE